MKLPQRLEQLVLEVQKHPIKSNDRRLALHKLICAIQQSGQISCQEKYNVPSDVYNKALYQTFSDVCHKIDKYDGATDVMTWVNQLLHRRLMAAIDR